MAGSSAGARGVNDPDDLLGPEPKKRGRPTKEVVAARQAAEGPGDWVDTHRGVNLNWLCNAFRMDSRTVKVRLAECPILRVEGARVFYDFTEAAQYLAKPTPAARAAYFRGIKVTDLPTFLQDQYWSAQRKRQIWEENAGDLWRTDAILEVFGDVFTTMKSEMQLWVDKVDEAAVLNQDQRRSLASLVDGLQEGIHAKLVELPAKRRTRNQLNSNEVVTERSPQYQGMFDEIEDMLG
jgi:hypothetical protein